MLYVHLFFYTTKIRFTDKTKLFLFFYVTLNLIDEMKQITRFR